MKKINKYWYVHWWYSFWILDDKLHNFACNYLGECLTSNASIFYHKPISPEIVSDLEFNISLLSKTSSSVTVEGFISYKGEKYVTSIFTFVKIRKN